MTGLATNVDVCAIEYETGTEVIEGFLVGVGETRQQ